jgi:hypothetical protein
VFQLHSTLFNPTNHVYFNLTGDPTQAIDEHKLWLNSDSVAVLRPSFSGHTPNIFLCQGVSNLHLQVSWKTMLAIRASQYQVAIDPETGHSLHGGKPGFETKKWDYAIENGDQIYMIGGVEQGSLIAGSFSGHTPNIFLCQGVSNLFTVANQALKRKNGIMQSKMVIRRHPLFSH